MIIYSAGGKGKRGSGEVEGGVGDGVGGGVGESRWGRGKLWEWESSWKWEVE